MNTKFSSSLELIRFKRSVMSACLVLPLSWRFDHYLVFLFFLLFSFAWNDYVDRRMDKDGHPERPLPSGRLSPIEAWVISVGLLGLGFAVCLLWAVDLTELFAYSCLVSALYSWVLKRHVPLIATPIWSLCVTYMVLLPTDMTMVGWTIFFCILYAHEILLDMRDDVADTIHCATPSIATLLGKRCWWVVFALMLIASNLVENGYIPYFYAGFASDHYEETIFIAAQLNLLLTCSAIVMFWTLYRMFKHEWDEVTTAIKFYKGLFPLCVLLI